MHDIGEESLMKFHWRIMFSVQISVLFLLIPTIWCILLIPTAHWSLHSPQWVPGFVPEQQLSAHSLSFMWKIDALLHMHPFRFICSDFPWLFSCPVTQSFMALLQFFIVTPVFKCLNNLGASADTLISPSTLLPSGLGAAHPAWITAGICHGN